MPGHDRYHFSDQNKVQRLFISEIVQKQLINGKLVIVKMGQQYELVPSEVGEKIKARDPQCVISMPKIQEKNSTEEDPYADYQVPDDSVQKLEDATDVPPPDTSDDDS